MNSYLPTATAMRSAHASFIGRIGRHFSKFSYSLLLMMRCFLGAAGCGGRRPVILEADNPEIGIKAVPGIVTMG